MLYFKGQPKKSTTNISGKMSLYSALSIITIIIICAAAWNLLDIAKNTYLKTIKGTHTAPPKQRTTITKTYQQTSLFRKLLAGFYLAAAALENIKDQGALKENEIKAAKILTKYAKAQEIYKKHYGDYAANASGLIIEENGKYIVIDSKLKVLNASYSKENPANGYYYVELVERGSKSHNSSFFLSAVPAQYGISGLNTFWIDKRGVVMKKNNGAKPIYYNINFLDESRGD